MEVAFLGLKILIALIGAGILLFNAAFLYHMYTKSYSTTKDKIILTASMIAFSLVPLYALFKVGTAL